MKSSIWSTMLSSFVSHRLRESEAHQFLLFNVRNDYSEVLEEVLDRKLQPGDILVFPMDSTSSGSSSIFKHAVVYCGDGEVIHFQKVSILWNISRISKEGFRAMKMERKEYRVYRKKGGIDPKDFHGKVKKAMNSTATYDLQKNNCIHFALFLVGLAEFYMELVEIPDEDCSFSDEVSLKIMV